MKKILIAFMIIAFCRGGLHAQKISALTEATVADDNSLVMTRPGSTGDVIKKITIGNIFKDRTLTGTVTLPATTSIGSVSDTEIGYVNGLNGTAASRQDISDSLDLALAGATTGIALSDSTGNAAGNYMTRQNYHNDMSVDAKMKNIKGFGSNIKALPVYTGVLTGTQTMADSRAYYVLVYIPETTVITGVKWYQHTAGDYTGDEFNGVALYKCDAAGTTSTRVAISDNSADCWKATLATINSLAFTGTYTAYPGYYYVSALYNSSAVSVAPILYAMSDLIVKVFNDSMADSKDLSAYVATMIAFPADETAADMKANANMPYLWLY